MTSHQPIILALTGGIACGKSETGRILEKQGFAVLDTDLLAHELMCSGTPLFEAVVQRFGSGVVGEDGELDRGVLGTMVFGDPAALADLNRLVHPAVIDAGNAWKEAQTGDAAVLIPLLFEAGWTDGWDAVVCVSADEETVFQRLEKRGQGRAEALPRISAQMPLSEKEERSEYTIHNSGTLEELRDEVFSVLECIRNQKEPYE